jgi:hypothetical protein
MRRRARPIFVLLTAALMLSLAVGTAAALRSINIRRAGGTNTIGATASVTFNSPEQPEVRIVSNVTLAGELESSIQKRERAVFGHITECRAANTTASGRAGITAIARCEALVEPNRSWRLIYKTFLGTLPNITGVLFIVERAGFLIAARVFGARANECLYEGEIGALASERARGLNFTEIRILEAERVRISLELEHALATCNQTGSLSGNFTLQNRLEVSLV